MDGKTLGQQPVHPGEFDYIGSNRSAANGITKREFFSILVLQSSISLCSSPEMVKAVKRAADRKGLDVDDYIARESVKTADRLLVELAKTQP